MNAACDFQCSFLVAPKTLALDKGQKIYMSVGKNQKLVKNHKYLCQEKFKGFISSMCNKINEF